MTRAQAVAELEKRGFVVKVTTIREVMIHASGKRYEIEGAPGAFIYPNPYTIVRRDRAWVVAWNEEGVTGFATMAFRSLKLAVEYVCKKGPRPE